MKVKYSNNAASTLSSPVAIGETAMAVVNVGSFPTLDTGDWMYVSVENEVVKVTAITGLTFTCEAFTADHVVGSSVQLRITSEVLNGAQDADVYTVPADLPVDGTMRLGEIWANPIDKIFGVGDLSGDPVRLTGVSLHSNAAKYYVNDIISYLGDLYTCTIEHTAGEFNLTNWKPTFAVMARNLCINPNFIVNQEEYAGGVITTGEYGHDMWISNSSASYTVSDGALTLVSGILGQRNDELVALHGEPVTVSLTSGTMTIGATGGAASIEVTAAAPYTFTLDMDEATDFITITAATSALGIKIESGAMATAYITPEPREEELRCYWYYQRFSINTNVKIPVTAIGVVTYFYGFMPLLGMLRASTALTEAGLDTPVVRSDTTYTVIAVTGGSVVGSNAIHMTFNVTASVPNAGLAGFFTANSGAIELDARYPIS